MSLDLPHHSPSTGQRPWRALGRVTRDEFDTPDYCFVTADICGDEAVLEGCISEVELQPGLWIHCTEVVDLHNVVSQVNLSAGLRIVMLLGGALDVTLGGHRLSLGVSDSDRPAQAAIVDMPQDALFERRWSRGKWERKLSIHLTPEWLRAHGWWTDHRRNAWQPAESVCLRTWEPSSYAQALAEQLLQGSRTEPDKLQRIRLAGRALELIYEALSAQHAPIVDLPATSLQPRDQARLLRIRAFLDSELQQPSTPPAKISDIGRRFGMSASTMQRQFRAAFGTSIDEYRRAMRLQQARHDLERGLSIAEAAFRAGYTSPANFATAFRRQFGITPRSLRPRV